MIHRTLSQAVQKAAEKLPVITVTGPRQSGKTTLVRSVFSEHSYYNLEYPDTREYASTDPRGFLQLAPRMIIDEVQHVPNLTSYMQGMVDEEKRAGQFVLTGSQNFSLAQSVSQSLAGRSAIFHLLPLSINELQAEGYTVDDYLPWLYQGFYPRLYDQNLAPQDWLPDYIQSYLERDVRQITQVKDLTTFQIFLKLCAGRTGQLLNMASLANETGVDTKTIKSWVSVLEASYIVFLLRPHYRNYGKRLVKTPKIYFYDTGLACSLLGIKSSDQLSSHYLKGELFESLIIAELQKHQYNRGQRPTDYFWRDNTGHEVDFLSEDSERVRIAEIKSGKTIRPEFFRGLDFYQKIASTEASSYLIYGGNASQNRSNYTVLPWNKCTDLFS
ncbi:ATP-binding protein [Tunicatimonas pelagia]|uniref:ATP-binding protein n=1 Tax=Tunicatimonas pelagia TaxID=931531 RepID=UPI002666B8D2|nr:ATP-binding protein [Tunicatimonas pelagia]WKN41141.1 ATP-binding protein [Tunicatimonas pelagia]